MLAYAGNKLAGLERRSFSDVGGKSGNTEQAEFPDISNGRFEILRITSMRFDLGGILRWDRRIPKGDEYAHAHNSYLQVAYNFGLAAGLLFLVLCALALWRAVRLFSGLWQQVQHCAHTIFDCCCIWVYQFDGVGLSHPCIPAGFGFILMQMLLMRDCVRGPREVKKPGGKKQYYEKV